MEEQHIPWLSSNVGYNYEAKEAQQASMVERFQVKNVNDNTRNQPTADS